MNQGVFQLQAQEMVIPYIKYVAQRDPLPVSDTFS